MTIKNLTAAFSAAAIALTLTFGFATNADASYYGGHHQNHYYGGHHQNHYYGGHHQNHYYGGHHRGYGHNEYYERHRGYGYGHNEHYGSNSRAADIFAGAVGGFIIGEILRPPERHYDTYRDQNTPRRNTYRNSYNNNTRRHQRTASSSIGGYPVVEYTKELYPRPVVQGRDGQLCIASKTRRGMQFFDVTSGHQFINYGNGVRPSNRCAAGPR